MKRWAAPLALVLGALLCGLAPIWIISTAAREWTVRVERLEQEAPVNEDSLSATWIDASGTRQTVTTVRRSGETDDELEARHDARVAKRKAKVGVQTPPQPPPEGT